MRILATTLVALTALAATPAQASEDTQYWQTLSVNVALAPNLKLQNENVFRSGEAKGLYEIESVLLLAYKPSKQVTIAAGYLHNPTYLHGNFRVMEHRLREQVSVDNFAKLGPVKFSARLRMEQRFREGVSGTAWRLRPYLKASMPLTGKASLNLTHESFVNLNNTSFQQTDGLDRMRNAISVSVPISKTVGVDFGYLNQHGFVRGGPDSSDHVLTLGLSANF